MVEVEVGVKPERLSLAREAIARNVAGVRARIAAACRRAGRDSASVVLVAVVKEAPAGATPLFAAAGVPDLGVNRVDDLLERVGAVAVEAAPRWHMVGHLQRNKAAKALPFLHCLHSLDSVELAEVVQRRLDQARGRLDSLVEVNIAREPQRSGVSPERLLDLLRALQRFDRVAIGGLMAMAPEVEDPEAARPCFRELRALRDEAARTLGLPLPQLSMGMSADYEVAVEEGATIVRIGRALLSGLV